ncbi:hypothetical protein B7494_g2363 [Chlorociboria aeruginascens]|nr:hypothetical protein B7494_g2363 [Chlorociboria aeruginascens]
MTTPIFLPSTLALITGGASGIGLALAKRCTRAGMHVLIVDSNAEALQSALEELGDVERGGDRERGKVEGLCMDVRREEEWIILKKKVEREFSSKISLLALNAGTAVRTPPGSSPWTAGLSSSFERTLGTNLFGVVHGIAYLLGSVVSAASGASPDSPEKIGSARIIITGSKQGITNPPGNPAYNASKAAVKSVAEGLDFEMEARRTGVSVHLLVPGWTFTGLTGRDKAKEKGKPDGAWTAEQVVEYAEKKIEEGKFYIVCPDNETSETVDRKRMLWGVGDIVYGRPALSRWREGWKQKSEEWMAGCEL